MDNQEHVCIFIDGSNFYHCLRKDIGDMNIDFQKLSQGLCGENRRLIRTYYYNAPLDMSFDKEKYKKQQQFFDTLRKLPNFKIILVRMQKRMLGGKPYFVVKGDDIHIAVEAVQSFGKRVENAYFKTGHSWHLRQLCDLSILLDQNFMKKCVMD